jgi:hypothetical protein
MEARLISNETDAFERMTPGISSPVQNISRRNAQGGIDFAGF